MPAAREPLAPPTGPQAPGARPPVQAREIWEQWAFVVPFAGRVLALQGMHPTVSAGLQQHSRVFDEPWQRAWETISYGLELLCGDTEAIARRVRELHRPISGIDHAGRRYHAWNREAWTWVHLSTFEATRYAAKAIGQRMTDSDEQRLYAEWKAAGRLLGVQDRDTPATLAAFEAYLAEMVAHRLMPTPTSTRLLALLSREPPPPPWLPLPPPIWKLGQRPAGHVVRTALVGSFPAALRERHGLAWTVLDQAQYDALLAALKAVTLALPLRLRQIPAGWRTLPPQG
ncbi:MAG TPA: oxygenase MpaB family protein [Solirubrobacteraceae bacterium]|nr:oxygenase MpaB family protein [Solirubrobacteraceae bacterium]